MQNRVNSISDKELMFLVRDGDPGRLAVLFDRHHRMLYNFFLKLTGNRDVSEDLVQEVFLRMLKYKHTYKGGSKFTIWMFQIARNARYDYFRKHKRAEVLDDESHDFASAEPIASDSLEKEQETEILRTALSQLPEEEREVLVLSRFQNIKYKQIAEILQCREGTIKARVHRAIKRLRDNFLELSGENTS